MSIYRRRDSAGKPSVWWIDARWRGVPRIQGSTGTENKTLARAILTSLRALKNAGRTDLLGLVASAKLTLSETHFAWLNDRERLTHALARANAPTLGELADEWLASIDMPGALSPRTKRPYAPGSTQRYRVSLNSIFATLPNGRETRTTDLTRGALLAFRDSRRKSVTGSSINRDLSALQALRRWCADYKTIRIADFNLPKERENEARLRWLSNEEIGTWMPKVPEQWTALFLTLVGTGMRVGEALGLTWGDVYLSESQIAIGVSSRVKTATSRRKVPFGATVAEALIQHASSVPSLPSEPVFPKPAFRYAAVRRAFIASCDAAGIAPTRLHDLRHTFAVHALQSGVPIPRLQRLLGHASPIMTLRYAAHLPEAYFEEDSARIEEALHGQSKSARIAQGSRLRRA